MCGEQRLRTASKLNGSGSPPRVRGTESSQETHTEPSRITPACAGNRQVKLSRICEDKDHPRVCGEQKQWHSRHSATWGSPPRVRGTAFDKYVQGGCARITPACAGNRLCPRCMQFHTKDHPRVCGEQTKKPQKIRSFVFAACYISFNFSKIL